MLHAQWYSIRCDMTWSLLKCMKPHMKLARQNAWRCHSCFMLSVRCGLIYGTCGETHRSPKTSSKIHAICATNWNEWHEKLILCSSCCFQISVVINSKLARRIVITQVMFCINYKNVIYENPMFHFSHVRFHQLHQRWRASEGATISNEQWSKWYTALVRLLLFINLITYYINIQANTTTPLNI